MEFTTKFIYLVLLAVLASTVSLAQGGLDSKGTDFWLAFPPNDRANGGSDSYISVFVTSDVACRVTIAATRRNGITDSTFIDLPANTVRSVRLDYALYELVGKNYSLFGANNDQQRPSPASVHITSSEDISCYALSREFQTSDAWLVLPTDALGTEYRVLSYSSDRSSLGRSYPSQFLIVASEDSTSVSIVLSVNRSASGNTANISTMLQRGESYLVQAHVSNQNQNDDLTGSLVRSNKPIVVLGSHMRVQAPLIGDNSSRDILVEQLIPVDTWGKNYIVPALALPADYLKQGTNDVAICRVLSHKDGTQIRVNGALGLPLNAGRRWDMPLTGPLVITSDNSILVAIIDRSSNRGSNRRNGDPSLIIVPPVEQFLPLYRVISIEPRAPGNEFYTEHYLTLTVPLLAGNSIRVDNVLQPAPTPIAGSTMGYIHTKVANGPHFVSCDSSFGIIIYGYGPAESYGYTGGMSFERLYTPTIRLKALDIVGDPGSRSNMVVVVDSITEPISLNALGVRELHGAVSFNQSMFVLDKETPTTNTEMAFMSFTYKFDTLEIGDTVFSEPGTITLGMKDIDTVTPISNVWHNASSSTVVLNTTTSSGLQINTLVCDENGKRLFSPLVPSPVLARVFTTSGSLVAEYYVTDISEISSQILPGLYIVTMGKQHYKLMVTSSP